MEPTAYIQSFEFMDGSICIYIYVYMTIIYKVLYRVTYSTYKNEIYGRVPTIRGAAHTAILMIENQTATRNFPASHTF